jgi:hypothetical protein
MRSGVLAVLFAVALAATAFAGTPIIPTTTLAAETANNTSTASTYAADASGNLGAANISKVDIRTLLYPGATAPIYVHFMGWFGTSSHINVGYTSWDAAQVHRQVDDMLSRGITGAILDWYGPNKWTEDSTAKLLKSEAETRNGQFLFALTEDKGALSACAATAGCDLTQQLISDLTYAYNTYEISPAYLRLNGRPLVFFFDVETDYAINWDLVVAAVPGNPLFIFRNSGGFSRAYSAGSYAWIGFPDTASDWGKSYLDNFYTKSLNYPLLSAFGAAYKGFNDALAAWGKNRYVPQDCGQTWLSTLAEIGRYYSSSRQLPFIQLATWNDYEEGTALETGIDNCVTVSGSTTGQTLAWTITGDEATIDHYTVFISADGQNLMPLADLPAGTHALDLSGYGFPAGSYTIYVKAVGKPSLKNQMSPAIAYTAGTASLPVTPPDFGVSLAPPSTILTAGQSRTLAVNITPQGGFSSPVTFSCSNLPVNATCSFNPGAVTPGASPVATNVTIVTASPSAFVAPAFFVAPASLVAPTSRRLDLRASRPHRAPFRGILFAFSLPTVAMFGIGLRRSRLRLLLLVLALMLLQVSCGQGTTAAPTPAVPGTPPGTYTITITAASGSLQHSVPATVTVQ